VLERIANDAHSSSFVSFACCSVFGAAVPESKDFDSKGLGVVSVENTTGKVAISSLEGAKATVVATKNSFSDKCTMTVDRSGNKLIIKVEKKSSFSFSAKCDVDFQINVPKTVDLDLAVGSGNLTVKGIEGELAFKMGSGDISAEGSFKKIDGKSGSGKIAIKGLTGDGEFKTGSGSVDLTYAVSSLKGELDLKTGSGNATVLFPKGTKVKTSFKTGSGEMTNEMGESPEAPFHVSMKAGSGDLKIKSY
jgi:hypothetical protein